MCVAELEPTNVMLCLDDDSAESDDEASSSVGDASTAQAETESKSDPAAAIYIRLESI
jgi:hypothetical protein